jgi:transcriptional regulator with XRE-family HTH domain
MQAVSAASFPNSRADIVIRRGETMTRTPEQSAQARHLARLWVNWLYYVQNMTIQAIADKICVAWETASRYYRGESAPIEATLQRIRAACAERYFGVLDDARWLAGPEPTTTSEEQSAAPTGRDPAAPRTRAECANGIRPCPFVACSEHLLLRVTRHGLPVVDGKTYSNSCGPHRVDWERVEEHLLDALEKAAESGRDTCALDVAEGGKQTLDQVGKRLGVTRERARQIETAGLRKLRASALADGYLP